MGIIRAVTTKHTSALNVEYRVGRHQPYKSKVGTAGMEPDGDPYPVVELWIRGDDGEYQMKASFKMENFIELSRDAVRIGNELCPPKDKKKAGKKSGDELD
jgi:hypothetical protein